MKKMLITPKEKNVMKKYFVLIAICMTCAFILGTVSANAAFIYGIKHPPASSQAEIYKIDFSTTPCTITLIATAFDTPVATSSYNGNAYDFINDRHYFSAFDNSPRTLHMISNFSTSPATSPAGILNGGISNGTIYNGKYYYIGHLTDDLYEVTFNANGTVNNEVKLADITGGAKNFYFGDTAYSPNGVLYGSASYGSTREFFSYYETSYTPISGTAPEALQIAFGDDGVLYGYAIAGNKFYTINTADGSLTEICDSSMDFSDLASGPFEINVDIDIKPGSYPNCFNINGHGVVPVAILGSADFDVTEIDNYTLKFSGLDVRVRGNKGPMCHIEDVSGDFAYPEGAPDGYPDLVCQFEDDPELWETGSSEAEISGELYDGRKIIGSDEICITQEIP